MRPSDPTWPAPKPAEPANRADWAWLVLLVLAVYFSRLAVLPLRGEESRRAHLAIETLQSGDWIVPREQGQVFADRPPLGSWAIAASILAHGRIDTWVVRLPTALATLGTVLLIYGATLGWAGRRAAFLSAVAYATMGQVLELGRLAETESTFTLLVGASLLVWLNVYVRGGLPAVGWTLGYLLAALAMLTKGAQAPVYFMGATWLFLLVRRDWSWLLSRGHALGLLAFVGLFAAWQVPFLLRVEWPLVVETWCGQAGARFDYSQPGRIARHLAQFPLETLACLAPWSIGLVGYLRRDLRGQLGPLAVPVGFLALAAGLAFLPVWLAPEARTRYYMPLYPPLAVLCGVAFDRSLAAAREHHLRRLWTGFLRVMAGGMLLSAGVVLAISLLPRFAAWPVAQPVGVAVAFTLACAVLAAAVLWAARDHHASRARWGALAVAAFMGLTFTGLVINAQARVANDPGPAVAALKEQLPPGTKLASFGRVHHLFRYLYETPIEFHPWPGPDQAVADDLEYFCLEAPFYDPAQLPFPWEPVAVIGVDRNRHDPPENRVVVGRRLPTGSRTAEREPPTKSR